MSDEYTPTTDDVRRSFVLPKFNIDPQQQDERFSNYLSRLSMEGIQLQVNSEAAFDRWRVEHEKEVQVRLLQKLSAAFDGTFYQVAEGEIPFSHTDQSGHMLQPHNQNMIKHWLEAHADKLQQEGTLPV